MRWLLFLSRVGLICGIAMIIAFSLLLTNWNRDEVISSSILFAGYGLAILVIPLVNLLYLFLWIFGKKPTKFVPGWLVFFNVLCVFILLVYVLVLNNESMM